MHHVCLSFIFRGQVLAEAIRRSCLRHEASLRQLRQAHRGLASAELVDQLEQSYDHVHH